MSTSRISVSKYVQNQMTSIWNMSSDVIHNGIDMSSTELFTEKKRDITKLSEILEISQTQWAEQFAAKRIVLYVGSLIDGKGVMDVIDVCEKRKDVLCIIVGRGYLKNKMANSLSKSQYILQRDFISPSNLAVLYASADVLFFPSVIDSFGLVYLEALASGLPVLSLKSAAAPEIITSAKLGILCANKGGLDGALTKILATKYNRSYLHKYVADNFSAKKMCGRYLAMYAGKEIK
jgi:glycosyltransferase involved in cell wall biosynthesis